MKLITRNEIRDMLVKQQKEWYRQGTETINNNKAITAFRKMDNILAILDKSKLEVAVLPNGYNMGHIGEVLVKNILLKDNQPVISKDKGFDMRIGNKLYEIKTLWLNRPNQVSCYRDILVLTFDSIWYIPATQDLVGKKINKTLLKQYGRKIMVLQ